MTIKALIIDYLGICMVLWTASADTWPVTRSPGCCPPPSCSRSGRHQHASGLVQCRLGAVHCSYSVTNNSILVFYFILSAPHRSNQAFTFQKISFVCFRENVLLLNQSAWKDPDIVCFAVRHDAMWRTLPHHKLVPQWSHQDYQIEQKINVNIIILVWDWSTSNM